MKWIKLIRKSIQSISLSAFAIWLVTSLVMASHAWLVDGLSGQGIFKDISNNGFYTWYEMATNDGTRNAIIYAFLGYTFLSFILYLLTFSLFRPVHEIRITKKPKCKVLIMTVSKPAQKTNFILENKTAEIKINDKTALLKLSKLEDDIATINESGIFWNWQQVLRGIVPHQDSVEKIYAVFTKSITNKDEKFQEDGTFKHQKLFVEWLTHYFDTKKVKIIPCETYLNPTSLGKCYEGYNDIIDEITAGKYTEQEVIFDITGGTSVMSSAASLSTIHNKVKFQYVNTEEPFNVEFYDLKLNINKQPIS